MNLSQLNKKLWALGMPKEVAVCVAHYKSENDDTNQRYFYFFGGESWKDGSIATGVAKINSITVDGWLALYQSMSGDDCMVEKTNLMSGKKFKEQRNTPIHMSPSSETYWSM